MPRAEQEARDALGDTVFEIDVRDILLTDSTALADAWWPQILEASRRGPEHVRTLARRFRHTLDDEQADTLGVRAAELFDLRIDPPGPTGALVAGIEAWAGPRTIARVGDVLRRDLDGAFWKIDVGLDILRNNRSRESVLQLRLCMRDATEVRVLQAAHEACRGFPKLMLELLEMGQTQVPSPDLERFFTLSLETAMLHGTRFRGGQLRSALETPARHALCRCLWARCDGNRVIDLFRVDPETNDLIGADYDAVALPDDAVISVPHPAEIEPSMREQWGVVFADFEIVTLFPQLDRELMPAARDLPFPSLDRQVRHRDLLRFLYRNGWTRHRESRAFDFRTRGALLELDTRNVDVEHRLLEHFVFHRRGTDHVTSDHVIAYSESYAAAVRVLEEFAPDLVTGFG